MKFLPSFKPLTSNKLIVLVSVFLVAFGNFTFFKNVLAVYPLDDGNALYVASVALLFICFNILLFSLVCFKYTLKPVLILILLVSSMAAYFMDTYNVILDDVMIDNTMKTDVHEATDLLSLQQVMYFLLLGVLPSFLVYRAKVTYWPWKKAIITRVGLMVGALALAVIMVLSLSGFYASFFREHKPLRYYANPSYYIYSLGKYIGRFIEADDGPLKLVGQDATVERKTERPRLVVFVVGETVRADHFSLNGYAKETTPELAKRQVINFSDTWSCGTSTAVSVPCMFSLLDRRHYKGSKARNMENVLDILQRVGVNVLWLDNNSSSKGVADRVPYESYKTAEKNPVCDTECRDEGMLANLQSYIDAHKGEDIFIVLHQMGNHGPAYYKRYPQAFARFQPECKTNQLEQCSNEEIANAYDNAVLYTDYFLGKTIDLLEANSADHDAAMLYVSDHGESLGEGNLYLHGMPYLLAPDAQKHVPMVLWVSDSFDRDDLDVERMRAEAGQHLSHDHLFHSILGLMGIKTEVYDPRLDFIRHD